MDTPTPSIDEFNNLTSHHISRFLAGRVVRTLVNQGVQETIPLLPQLFQQTWEHFELGDSTIVPSHNIAESLLKANINIIWGHIARSILLKGGEYFKLSSPSGPPSHVPSAPSLTNIEEHITASTTPQTKTEYKDTRSFGEIYDEHVNYSEHVPFTKREGGLIVMALVAAPLFVLGVGVGVGVGVVSGALAGVGYGLGTFVGGETLLAGAIETEYLREVYQLKNETRTVITNEITREKLEEESKEAFNRILDKLEDGMATRLCEFMEGSSPSDEAEIDGVDCSSSPPPPPHTPEQFREIFGKALGITFDQHTLSQLATNPLPPLLENSPQSLNSNEKDNWRMFVLSVSVDPDQSIKTHYIISALVTPSPSSSCSSSSSSSSPETTPFLHHFRLRFSTCRNIYQKIYYDYPNHNNHFESFPARTLLPCYEPSFLKERAEGLLRWLRVCESDEGLCESLWEEFRKVFEVDDVPCLELLPVVKDIRKEENEDEKDEIEKEKEQEE